MLLRKLLKRTRFGLASASLVTLLVLSGCSTQTPQPKGFLAVPDAYTEETPEPALVADLPKGELSNAQLSRYIPTLRKALAQCNADKASTRALSAQPTKE